MSTLIWMAFWIGISILAIVPDEVSRAIMKVLGFKSNVTAVIWVALGFLFIFMFYTTAMVEKMEKQMTNLVRKMALENQELKEEIAQKELQYMLDNEKKEELKKIS